MDLKCTLTDREYQALRVANMRGQVNAAGTFYRHTNGEVVFETIAPRMLCDQLDRVIDFGAISAREVFHAQMTLSA